MFGGGQKRIDAQHAKGKLTARERLEVLLDEGSFEEYDMYKSHRCTDFGMESPGVSRATACHRLGHDQRPPGLCVFQDFTVFGGSLSETHAEKICKVMDIAVQNGAPIIGLNRFRRRAHPGRRGLAWRLCRGVLAQCAGLGRDPADFRHHGPLRRRRVYSPAMTDFIFMVKDTSYMFVTGPDVVKTVTNEIVTAENSAAPRPTRRNPRSPTAPTRTTSRR
jgi:propionyl-CoA carboxylase beta chain